MFDDLLPLRAEAPRCSDFARSLELRPPGTGLYLERVIIVGVALPWPKPALKHPVLEAAARLVQGSTVTSRLFAAEPFASEPGGESLAVEVYERHGASTIKHAWIADDAAAIEPLVAAISDAKRGSLDEVVASGSSPVSMEAVGPTFLVCVQGSHDMCCGTSGVALADELVEKRPEYAVRRVSHTGGHRFSPTLLAFPEGRMWAYADLSLVDRIAKESTTSEDHRQRARGWWGAKVGPAQVAECAVRAELAERPFAEPLVAPVVSSNGSMQFSVAAEQHVFAVDVSVGRQVPSISCEVPGGLPAKPGREFAWTIDAVSADEVPRADGPEKR